MGKTEITGKQVKNGSLGPEDFATSTRAPVIITLTGNASVSAEQLVSGTIVTRGALSGNVNLTFPDVAFSIVAIDETTGGNVTVKRASTSGQVLSKGEANIFYSDGL